MHAAICDHDVQVSIQSKFKKKKIIENFGPYVLHNKRTDSPYVLHFKQSGSPYVVHFRYTDCPYVVHFKFRDCLYV